MFCVGEGWLLSLLIPYMVSSSGPESFILEPSRFICIKTHSSIGEK